MIPILSPLPAFSITRITSSIWGCNAHRQILISTELTVNYGAEGLQEGVQGAMVNVMLRSMSLVFGHAIFSGIFSYFIALAFVTKERVGALVLVGLLVAATATVAATFLLYDGHRESLRYASRPPFDNIGE